MNPCYSNQNYIMVTPPESAPMESFNQQPPNNAPDPLQPQELCGVCLEISNTVRDRHRGPRRCAACCHKLYRCEKKRMKGKNVKAICLKKYGGKCFVELVDPLTGQRTRRNSSCLSCFYSYLYPRLGERLEERALSGRNQIHSSSATVNSTVSEPITEAIPLPSHLSRTQQSVSPLHRRGIPDSFQDGAQGFEFGSPSQAFMGTSTMWSAQVADNAPASAFSGPAAGGVIVGTEDYPIILNSQGRWLHGDSAHSRQQPSYDDPAAALALGGSVYVEPQQPALHDETGWGHRSSQQLTHHSQVGWSHGEGVHNGSHGAAQTGFVNHYYVHPRQQQHAAVGEKEEWLVICIDYFDPDSAQLVTKKKQWRGRRLKIEEVARWFKLPADADIELCDKSGVDVIKDGQNFHLKPMSEADNNHYHFTLLVHGQTTAADLASTLTSRGELKDFEQSDNMRTEESNSVQLCHDSVYLILGDTGESLQRLASEDTYHKYFGKTALLPDVDERKRRLTVMIADQKMAIEHYTKQIKQLEQMPHLKGSSAYKQAEARRKQAVQNRYMLSLARGLDGDLPEWLRLAILAIAVMIIKSARSTAEIKEQERDAAWQTPQPNQITAMAAGYTLRIIERAVAPTMSPVVKEFATMLLPVAEVSLDSLIKAFASNNIRRE